MLDRLLNNHKTDAISALEGNMQEILSICNTVMVLKVAPNKLTHQLHRNLNHFPATWVLKTQFILT